MECYKSRMSRYVQNLVQLERKPPFGMVQHVVERGLNDEFVLLFITHVAGLQEVALGLNVVVACHIIVACINHFQLVAAGNAQGGIEAELKLRAARDVVNRDCDGTGAVGLHGYLPPQCVDGIAEGLVGKECRLTARQDDQPGGVSADFMADFGCRHRGALLVPGVAEEALKIAARKTDEDCSASRVVAFTLNRIEYFVDFIVLLVHQSSCRLCKPPRCPLTPAHRLCSIGESAPSSSGQCFQPWD